MLQVSGDGLLGLGQRVAHLFGPGGIGGIEFLHRDLALGALGTTLIDEKLGGGSLAAANVRSRISLAMAD